MNKKIVSFFTAVLLLFGAAVPAASTSAEGLLEPAETDEGYVYEFEQGELAGGAFTASDLAGFSGSGYVNIAGGSITMRIDVPYEGYYNVYIAASADRPDANNAAFYCSMNENGNYLVSVPVSQYGKWAWSNVGTEDWTDGVLDPEPPAGGYYFSKGENTVTLSQNWGNYAYFDRLLLSPVGSDQPEELINPDCDFFGYKYEFEDGKLGGSAYVSTENTSFYSGSGYVNIMDGTVELDINVPYAGKYSIIYYSSANSETENRCDYFIINGEQYLIATYPGTFSTDFYISRYSVGNEAYDYEGRISPKPPEEGFEFSAGKNTVLLKAHWGYCCYDAFYLIPKELEVPEDDPAAEVIAAIDALPGIATAADAEAVLSAEALYDALSPAQKLAVHNFDKLERLLGNISQYVKPQNPVVDGDRLIYETEQDGSVILGEGVDKGYTFSDYSGSGYIYVLDGSFEMHINVPEAGNYRMYVAGANDANGARCDYISINGGDNYLIATPADPVKSWVISEPGTENWVNNELKPLAPENGFAFEEGKNTIRISANWGYAAYDRIMLIPLNSSSAADEQAVDELNRLIAELPDIVTAEDADNVISLYEKYLALSDSDKALVKDVDRLLSARAMALAVMEDASAPAGTLRFECEEGVMSGSSSVVSEKTAFSDFAGNGYVFLFDNSFSVDVYVPEDGYYRLSLVSGSTDGNSKCDYVSVNGGERLLIATNAAKGVWETSQPGTENWKDGKLVPLSENRGVYLNAGKNTIEISANWGYCAYDSIILLSSKIPSTGDSSRAAAAGTVMLLSLAAAALAAYRLTGTGRRGYAN